MTGFEVNLIECRDPKNFIVVINIVRNVVATIEREIALAKGVITTAWASGWSSGHRYARCLISQHDGCHLHVGEFYPVLCHQLFRLPVWRLQFDHSKDMPIHQSGLVATLVSPGLVYRPLGIQSSV
jgi:hypothetical protein